MSKIKSTKQWPSWRITLWVEEIKWKAKGRTKEIEWMLFLLIELVLTTKLRQICKDCHNPIRQS
jgi:hypothetical protein